MSTMSKAWKRGQMDPNRDGQADRERWAETESRAWEIQGQGKEPEEQMKK